MTALAITPRPMSLRRRLRRWRARRSPEYRRATEQHVAAMHGLRTVSVTIAADTRGFVEALDKTAASLRAVRRHVKFRRELAIVRGEARWYIRGGLNGMFVTPARGQTLAEARAEERDIHVQAMLATRMHPRWVAAYLRGWCDSYDTDDDRDPYVLHELWPRRTAAATAIQVRA